MCGRARSLVTACGIPAPVRLVNHRVANIGQAEATPNVKHDGRKTIDRKRSRRDVASKFITSRVNVYPYWKPPLISAYDKG